MFGGSKSAAPSKPAAPARQHSTQAAPQHHAPAPVAAPAAHPPAPMMSSAPQGGGFMSTMVSGLAFGTGSAIAHRAVGAIAGSLMGGSSDPASAAVVEQAVQEPVKNECSSFQQDFIKCLQGVSARRQCKRFSVCHVADMLTFRVFVFTRCRTLPTSLCAR